MSLKSILFAGSAFASLFAFAGPAEAAPYYRCGDGWCYDDQYEETRELNLLQLENPGTGAYAVPGYRGRGYDGDDNDDYGDDDNNDDYGDRHGTWGDRYGDDDEGGYGDDDDDDDYGD